MNRHWKLLWLVGMVAIMVWLRAPARSGRRATGLQELEGLRRRRGQFEVHEARSDHQGERQQAAGGLDLSHRGQHVVSVQPGHRRQRDVRAGEGQLPGGAGRHHRQGDLDSREPARHLDPRHQLLGKQGPHGSPADFPDQSLHRRDRRADRQVDPDLRDQRPGRSARGPRARPEFHRARQVRHARAASSRI